MNLPRFTIHSSVGKPTGRYASASVGWAEFVSNRLMALEPGQLAAGFFRVAPFTCKPSCGPCLPDSTSRPGCSMTCQTAQGEPIDRPCVGCGIRCPTGFTLCGSECVNLRNDPNNCGRYGNTCQGGLICQNSSCVCAPPACVWKQQNGIGLLTASACTTARASQFTATLTRSLAISPGGVGGGSESHLLIQRLRATARNSSLSRANLLTLQPVTTLTLQHLKHRQHPQPTNTATLRTHP
jgi:hypothetical protein